MANKEAIFRLKLDTGNAVSQVQKLDKSTQTLNKDLDALSQTAEQDLGAAIKELEGQMEKMAMAGKRNTQEYKALGAELSRLQGIFSAVESDIKVLGANMEDVSGSISAMEDRLYTLAATGNKNTQEFKDLFAELTRLKTVQREVDAIVDQSSISMDDTSAAVGLLEDRMYRLAVQGKQNTKEYRDLTVQIAKYKTTLLDADMAVETQMITTNDLSGSIGKLEDRMYALQAQGKQNTKEFRQSAQQLVEYKKQLQGVDMQIDAMMQGGMRLNTALSVGNTAMAGMQGFEASMKLAGIESETMTKAMQKMQLAVTVLTSIQQVSIALQRQGLIMTTLRNAADSIRNFVLTGQFAATEALVAAEGELIAAESAETVATGASTAADVAATGATGALTVAKEGEVLATGEQIAAGVSETTTKGAQTVATTGLAAANSANAAATTTATLATKALRVAMIATGIGAIIVAVALLVTYWRQISDALVRAYDWFNKLGPAVKIVISIILPFIGVIYGAIKALEYFGIIDEEQTRKMKANAEKRTKERDKELKKEASNIKARGAKIQAGYDFEIRMAQASGKSTVELERKKIVAMINTTKQLKTNIQQRMNNYWQEMQMLKKLGDQDSDRYKKLQKEMQNFRKQAKENNHALYKNTQDLKVFDAEQAQAAREAAKERAEAAKQAAEASAQAAEDKRRAIIEIEKAERAELLALEKEYQDNLLSLKEDGQEKEREQAIRAFEEYKTSFLDKTIAAELKAEEEKFAKGKISKEQYEQNIAAIRMNAVNNLSEEERKVLMSKEALLNKDLAGIDQKYLDIREKLQEEYQATLGDEFDKELFEFTKTQSAKAQKLTEMLKAQAISEETYRQELEAMDKAFTDKQAEIAFNRNEKYQAMVRDKYDAEILELRRKEQETEAQLTIGYTNGFINEQQYQDALIRLQTESAIKQQEIIDAKAKEERELQLQGITDTLTMIQGYLDTLGEINNSINEAQNGILERQRTADEQRIKDLEDKKAAELANENLTAEQKKAIEKKYAMDTYKIQLAMFEREEKIKKQQFERDKAFKIASAITGTAMAIVKAIAEFGPPPSPLGIAGIASATAIGAAQIAAIAAQKYKAGAAPSMPSFAEGGGAGMAGASASSFTVSQNTQGTNIEELMSGQSGGKIPMAKVVVLESDITGVQNKVAAQEKLSTY